MAPMDCDSYHTTYIDLGSLDSHVPEPAQSEAYLPSEQFEPQKTTTC